MGNICNSGEKESQLDTSRSRKKAESERHTSRPSLTADGPRSTTEEHTETPRKESYMMRDDPTP